MDEKDMAKGQVPTAVRAAGRLDARGKGMKGTENGEPARVFIALLFCIPFRVFVQWYRQICPASRAPSPCSFCSFCPIDNAPVQAFPNCVFFV